MRAAPDHSIPGPMIRFMWKKRLQWATRANEFFENPETIDTYARLLYKTGK